MRIIQKYIKYEQKNIIIDTFSIHYGSVFACCSTYGAQNEAYMSRSAEKWVRALCFNELGVCG